MSIGAKGVRITALTAAITIGAMALGACSKGVTSVGGLASNASYHPHRTVVSEDVAGSTSRSCDRPTLIGTVTSRRVTARTAPDPFARPIDSFPRTGAPPGPQVFDLLDEVAGADGERWYLALLPIRPNGTTGYLQARSLRLSQTDYRLTVDRSRLKLTVRKGCSVMATYPIGLGTKDTPTPVGNFYLLTLLKPPTTNSIYGTYAYGLSAYSNALTDWVGGGIIGLHGTNDPSSIGRRESHGCIRMRNRNIEHLTRILPLGTPIEIR